MHSQDGDGDFNLLRMTMNVPHCDAAEIRFHTSHDDGMEHPLEGTNGHSYAIYRLSQYGRHDSLQLLTHSMPLKNMICPCTARND